MTKRQRIVMACREPRTSGEIAAIVGGTRNQTKVTLHWLASNGLVRCVGRRTNKQGPPSLLWKAASS
jgi:predicted ArsR family transcriptional regulator